MERKKWKALFSCSCSVLLLLLMVSQATADQNLTVYKNESIVITLKNPFSEYAIGNDKIAGCVVKNNDAGGAEVVVNGIQQGTTNLIFWDKAGQVSARYNIIVKVRDLGQILADVRKLIAGIQGVSAELIGGKVIVKGQVLSTDDMKKVYILLSNRPHVINTVTLGPEALKVLVKIINEFAGGESQIKVKTVGQTLVLVGTSYGKGSAKRIEQFAKIFHTSVVNLIKEKQVGLDPGADKMIQVYVHFMEVNNKAMEALGASWTPFGSLDLNGSVGEKITNGDRTKNSIWQLSGFLTNLLPKFQNGRERDMGRQLKVSSVSVKSGEKAEFQSGGEVGYPVVSSSGTTSLSFKKYGISMEVLPIAQGNFITLRIKVQINLPTNLGSAETGSSAAYLNFTNSEVKTVQYCASGDSIALSGLLGQIDRKTFDADPGSSGALFQLFRSKQFEQEKSELVIFITPEILAQAKQANEEIKQKVMQSFESYDPISR